MARKGGTLSKVNTIEIWCEEFAGVLEFMLERRPTVRSTPMQGRIQVRPGDCCIEQKFTTGLGWLCAPQSSWRPFSDALLRASGIDDAGSEMLQSTWLDVSAQSFAAFARTFGRECGRAFDALTPSVTESADPMGEGFSVSVAANGVEYTVVVVFSPELTACMDVEAKSAAEAVPGDKVAEGKVADMGVLLDVEVPLAVSFGTTYLALRDVLKLSGGSVVELNRLITEPVDVLVNNNLVARGEVVVIDGNYGIRVLEVVSRNDRLAARHAGRPMVAARDLKLNAGA